MPRKKKHILVLLHSYKIRTLYIPEYYTCNYNYFTILNNRGCVILLDNNNFVSKLNKEKLYIKFKPIIKLAFKLLKKIHSKYVYIREPLLISFLSNIDFIKFGVHWWLSHNYQCQLLHPYQSHQGLTSFDNPTHLINCITNRQ